MAKKIRFPLQMKDGAAVRTLEELREHFDLESVLGYFADGKLKTWLSDRYYDEMAEKVASLTADTLELNAKLCEILGVDYFSEADDTDLEALQRRNEKLRVLREVTDDQEILNNVDSVAFDQDELFDILDDAPSVIYLYGDKFSIPYSKSGITYIGVNNPEVLLEKRAKEYRENEILFQNVRNDDLQSDETDNSSFNCTIQDAEDMILEGKYQEAFPIILQLAENGNARAMYHMARYYHEGYNTVQIDWNVRDEWLKNAANFHEPLSSYMYAHIVEYDEGEKIVDEIYDDIVRLAESGDVIAQCTMGSFFSEFRSLEKKEYWLGMSATHGYALAYYRLGETYESIKDNQKAIIWYQKAAEQGHASAQIKLGLLLENSHSDIPNQWIHNSSNQGNPEALGYLGWKYKDSGYSKYGEEEAAEDFRIAIKLFQKAAEQGDYRSMRELSLIYDLGNGVEIDLCKAQEWQRMSDIAFSKINGRYFPESSI